MIIAACYLHYTVRMLSENLAELPEAREIIFKLIMIISVIHHIKYIFRNVNTKKLLIFIHTNCVRKEQSTVFLTTLKQALMPNELFRIVVEKRGDYHC